MGVNPDSIPRYGQPMDPPEPERSCGYCAHACDMAALGKYMACCLERDTRGTAGELHAVTPWDEACDDWEEAG